MVTQQYDYDISAIREELTIEQIFDLLSEFHAEPIQKGSVIVSKTICHHTQDELAEAGHKLYYYENSHLFTCYSGCPDRSYDIFELVRKVKSQELGQDYSLPAAVEYVASYFGFSKLKKEDTDISIATDLTILKNYDRINSINIEKQIVELKEYDDKFLKNLPTPIIQPWIADGISKEVMDYYEICYNPKSCGVVIPHRDLNGRLIGIRERTLIKEQAETYGKYMPMTLNGKMYNHPLSFNLYGLYQNKENIKAFKKAIILESEKSVLQYATMFGQENNIALAVCGSSFIQYQAWLLIEIGVEEIIIGLDKQYKELNDKEHQKLVRNLKGIHTKYGHFVKISYLFDKEDLLPYKASPTDMGEEVFMKLVERKVDLY